MDPYRRQGPGRRPEPTHIEKVVVSNKLWTVKRMSRLSLSKSAKLSTRNLKDAASAFDKSPFSPAKIADHVLDHFFDKREKRAATNETWSDIQRRRYTDGMPGTIFLSDDLTLADAETQRRIANSITPDPWWLPVARALSSFTLRTAVNGAIHAGQRVRRGWDDTATYDLGHHLAIVLADQLDHLAETTHGWPNSEEFPSFEDWERALHEQAVKLRRVRHTKDAEDALQRWHDLVSEQHSSDEDIEQACMDLRKIEEENAAAVMEAMHWVAEHMQQLWD